MKRYVYREEAKCNFCSDWFAVFSQIKFGLNICERCIEKALNTSCFKLPAPNNYLYQVYLVEKHLNFKEENGNEDSKEVLDTLDDFMHQQFKKQIKKWAEISSVIKRQMRNSENSNFERKVKSILEQDDELFEESRAQIMNKLKGNNTKEKQKFRAPKESSDIFCTPLRQKNENIPQKSSATRSIKRNSSKASLKLMAKQNMSSASIKRSIYLNLGPKTECSPFTLNSSTHRQQTNPDMQEQKQFTSRMQKLKTNISSFLENEQSVNPVMQNIMREKIYEAIQNTNIMNKCIELVSYQGLQDIDFKCYLKNLDWEGVEVVKLVRVGLSDGQLKEMIQQIQGKEIETLVLTGNNLTQESIGQILRADLKSLKNLYLSKNQMIGGRIKGGLRELRERYNVYI